MVLRFPPLALLLLTLFALGLGLTLSAPTRAAIEPVDIACPNGQKVLLNGSGAPPSEALIVRLNNRSVGGGSSDRQGKWQIPISANERPGIYEVEVATRASRLVVGRFNCYVNVPLADTPSATLLPSETTAPIPEITEIVESPTSEILLTPTSTTPANNAASPTSTTPANARPGGTTTVTRTPTRTTTVGAGTTQTTTRTTQATTTRTTQATTPTITGTPGTLITDLTFNDIICRDPDMPEDSEYVELINTGDLSIEIGGWKIVAIPGGNNTRSTNITYTFQDFEVEGGPGTFVLLYSGEGEDDLTVGDFYWNRDDQIWFVDDRAELYDNVNRLVASFTVQEDSCLYN